jgi:hypothetical protein
MEIPRPTIEQLNESRTVGQKLNHIVLANKRPVKRAAKEQLSSIFEMLKGIHAAFVKLVEAN